MRLTSLKALRAALAGALLAQPALAQERNYDLDSFPPPRSETLRDLNSTPPSAPDTPPPTTTTAQRPTSSTPVQNYRVYLGSDGNLPGRLQMLLGNGVTVPVQGTISFMQNGREVLSTQSDERGFFQAVGIAPGVYTVTAVSPEGGVTTGVEILPHDPQAPLEMTVLVLTLGPLSDQQLEELLQQQLLSPMMPALPAAGGFGGGGGGGGDFGLLGAALGAVGIGLGAAALADDDNNNPPPPVSPFQP